MDKISLVFWQKGTKEKSDAQGFASFLDEWWQQCREWLAWPLKALNPENAPLFMVDLLAYERDVQRYSGEPESLYRLRVKTAYANAKDAGTKAGLERIWARLGLGYIEISEREDAENWDIVRINVTESVISEKPELLKIIVEKYGRTCRRYEYTTVANIDLNIMSASVEHFTDNMMARLEL